MSRRRVIGSREILPDPKYGNLMLAKFINMVMQSGKKSVAERIIYGALDQIAGKGNEAPVEVLDKGHWTAALSSRDLRSHILRYLH